MSKYFLDLFYSLWLVKLEFRSLVIFERNIVCLDKENSPKKLRNNHKKLHDDIWMLPFHKPSLLMNQTCFHSWIFFNNLDVSIDVAAFRPFSFNWILSSTSQCFVTSKSKGAFVAILQKQSFAKINVMRFASIAWGL